MSALQAIAFNTVEDFVDGLNSYVGDNIWNDFIYGSEILDDVIDEEASADGDGAIYLESGRMIAYEEQRHEWAAYLPSAGYREEFRLRQLAKSNALTLPDEGVDA